MNSKGKSRSSYGHPKFMDATKIHIPEDWIIVEMTEEAFKKYFFHKNCCVIRSNAAYYFLSADYQLVFAAKGSNENQIEIDHLGYKKLEL